MVSDIPAGDGKSDNLFFQCMLLLLKETVAGDYLIRCLHGLYNALGATKLKCGIFFFFAGKLHDCKLQRILKGNWDVVSHILKGWLSECSKKLEGFSHRDGRVMH